MNFMCFVTILIIIITKIYLYEKIKFTQKGH